MSDFRQLSAQVWASPQITPAQVAEAGRLGFVAIVNNRPDEEAQDQPGGNLISNAAAAAGMAYHAIPITHAGFDEAQVAAMADVLRQQSGPILAYCRSGTRSTLLWALARAAMGDAPGELAKAAHAAGYDLAPIGPALENLSARVGGSSSA